MKISNRIWRGITCGGLSLALVSGLPVSAWAAANNNASNPNNAKTPAAAEHRQEWRAMHEKMMAQAKADDEALQKMVAELNKAPESKKVDLEAAILTKLVEQHHQMLTEWQSMHAQRMAWRQEHRGTMGKNSGAGSMHGMMGQNTTTTQK